MPICFKITGVPRNSEPAYKYSEAMITSFTDSWPAAAVACYRVGFRLKWDTLYLRVVDLLRVLKFANLILWHIEMHYASRERLH
jgi:hypothetical protein